MAAASFAPFGGDLLIGNFGDGRISAYQDRGNGHWVYKGQLRIGNRTLLAIDGYCLVASFRFLDSNMTRSPSLIADVR